MTRDEARQLVRQKRENSLLDANLLRAHAIILSNGMIGAGDSAKLIEIADAVGSICSYLARRDEQ